MHKIQARTLIFIFDILALICAVITSGIISRYISYKVFGHQYYDLLSEMALRRFINFAAMSSVIIFLFYNQEHYTKRIPWWNQVRYIISALSFVLVIEVFIHFAVKNQISRLWIFSSWLLALFYILAGRQIAKIIGNYFGFWRVKTIIIGDKDNIIETVFALYSENYAGYKPVTLVINQGFDEFDVKNLPALYKNIEIINGSKNFEDVIKRNNDCFYVIAPDSFKNIENLIEKVKNETSTNYAIVPPIEGIKLYQSKPQYFFGHDVMFLLSSENISSPLAKVTKRLMDIVGSLIGIIVLSPLLLIMIFLIKKDSGPVFFYQKRVGRNNKIFKCWKFRSMIVNAEEALQKLLENDPDANKMWQEQHKLINDPRTTKIGKFLRSSSIDEFPQLFNVLKGEMSLVGPRPIVEAEKK